MQVNRFSASMRDYRGGVWGWLMALTVLVGCDAAGIADWSDWERASHEGIGFAIPPDRMVVRGRNMIDLPKPSEQRLANELTIWIDARPTSDQFVTEGTVEQGSGPAPWSSWKRGAGSGGTEYGFMTIKRVGDRDVSIHAVLQTEWGRPSFSEAWAVWESLHEAE